MSACYTFTEIGPRINAYKNTSGNVLHTSDSWKTGITKRK